jgi:hypothetical protein
LLIAVGTLAVKVPKRSKKILTQPKLLSAPDSMAPNIRVYQQPGPVKTHDLALIDGVV